MAGFENDIVFALNADFTEADNQSPVEANGLITDGDLWIGTTALNAGSTHINVGRITSPDASVVVGYSSPDITLTAVGASPTTFTGNTGTANPVLNNVNIFGASTAAGTTPVSTAAAVDTVTVNVQKSQAIAATDATKVGLSNFDSAAFDVDANGFVQLNGGGIATSAFDVQANTAPGTDPVVPTAAGVVTINGAAVANHSVVLETRSRAANAYNIEVQYGTSAAATDATKSGVAHFNSAQFTVDANGFVSTSGTGIPNTLTGDSGGALSPTAGNFNIFGLSGSKTSGSGSTITVKSPPFSQVGASATSSLNTGEFVTAAVTRTLPVSAGLADGDLFIYVCTTAGALVIQAVGAQKIRLGSSLSSAAGTLTSTAIGDSITLRFDATDGFFYAVSVIGNWTVA